MGATTVRIQVEGKSLLFLSLCQWMGATTVLVQVEGKSLFSLSLDGCHDC